MSSGFLPAIVAVGTAHAALPAQKAGQYAPAAPGIFGALVALVLVLVYVGMCLWYFWLTGRRERALRFFTRLRHPFGGAKPGDGRVRFADDAVAGE